MNDLQWVLICAGLVFLMQPGFMCLESGLTRSKNNINVAVKNLADFGISVMLFWMFGYGVMFGLSRGGLIGTQDFFLDVGDNFKLGAFFSFKQCFAVLLPLSFQGLWQKDYALILILWWRRWCLD